MAKKKNNQGIRVQRFLSVMNTEITQLKKNGKNGTAKSYTSARCSFENFIKQSNMYSETISQELITQYEAWFKTRGITRNTSSFYIRILRAVYNKIIVGKHLSYHPSPFEKVYTGIDRTDKRAVDENVIQLLKEIDLSHSIPLSFARDLFIFSFYTRGMAFVDIAFLKKSNIKDGTIQYVRRKTGQPMSIRIEHCIQEIIDRYSNQARNSLYLFPILNSNKEILAYKQYQNWLSYYNKQLKRLSQELKLSRYLTSYVSRHTWATTARNKNIPISVISAAMGHSSETTTRIYLANLDTDVVDDANRRIIMGI